MMKSIDEIQDAIDHCREVLFDLSLDLDEYRKKECDE